MNNVKIHLCNNQMTVVLPNGELLFSSEGSIDLFNAVKNSQTVEDIQKLLAPELTVEQKKVEKEINKVRNIQQGLDLLLESKEFIKVDNSFYFKGIERSLPQMLVEELCEALIAENDNYYKALKNFWFWCTLNPRAEVTNNLFAFLKKNTFRINKQGFFYALRNVVTVEEDNELVRFVSEQYAKIKGRWKKNPNNYNVWVDESETYYCEPVEKEIDSSLDCVGNLKELYLNLPDMTNNRFTDAHTQTYDIRIGKPVSMPPEECSWSTADCAEAGLHFTLDEIHYVGCGDTSIVILINPSKVVGIGESKGRCYEYLPICTVAREEATEYLKHEDFDSLSLEEEYALEEVTNLEEKAKTSFAVEAKKHEFNMPQISTKELRTIVNSLESIKDELSKRVVSIS